MVMPVSIREPAASSSIPEIVVRAPPRTRWASGTVTATSASQQSPWGIRSRPVFVGVRPWASCTNCGM